MVENKKTDAQKTSVPFGTEVFCEIKEKEKRKSKSYFAAFSFLACSKYST